MIPSVVRVYFCRPRALRKLADLYSKSLGVSPTIVRPVEAGRMAMRGKVREGLLVVEGFSSLVSSPRFGMEDWVEVKKALKRLGAYSHVLVEAKELSWSPGDTGHVTVAGRRLPVASIDAEKSVEVARQIGARETDVVVVLI